METYAQQNTLDLLGGPNAPKCENRSLRFSRFTNPSLKEEPRRLFLEIAIQQKCPHDVVDAVRASHLSFLESIPDAVFIHAKNQSRLLLNMSGGVLENAGVSLERFSGLPIIPGSAVKGVTRHAAIQQLLDARQEEKSALLADIALAFGWVSDNWRTTLSGKQKLMDGSYAPVEDFFYACPEDFETVKKTAQALVLKALNRPDDSAFPKEFAGLIAFFDAVPSHSPGTDLELDIVTSHHPGYYREEQELEVALDTESPNPVVFPAIAAKHTFTFAVAPRSSILFHAQELHLHLRDMAKDWLFIGLTDYGIGAKTAAGYGWFDDVTKEVIKDKREAAEAKAAQAKAEEDARKLKELSEQKQKEKEAFDKLSVIEKLDNTIEADLGKFKLVLEKFASFSIDDQKAVVTWFASGNGKAHWAKVFSGKRPFREATWKQVELAIRKVRKDNNLEKLPL